MDEMKKMLGFAGAWATTAMLGALGMFGYLLGRKDEDPLIGRLQALQRHQEKADSARESAVWATTRAGEYLRQAILVPDGRDSDRTAFLQAAFAYAAMAHGSFATRAKSLDGFGDAERKMLSDLSIELPSSDADVDYLLAHASDLPADLRQKLEGAAAEIHAVSRERQGLPKDPERSVWRMGWDSESRNFADLSESERSEVLQEHSESTVASVLRARWKKHAPAPAPAPAPATEPTP